MNSSVRGLNKARARKVHACVHAWKSLWIILFYQHSLLWHMIDEISWKNPIPMSGACAAAQARKGRQAHARGLDGWRGGPYCNSDDFSSFTLSRGPLEAEINVFSDGLSENDRKSQNERDHKFYRTSLIFGWPVNFFFPTWKGIPGAYSEPFCDILGHREHPERVVSFNKKIKKEGERVAQDHFHEREGESPGRYKNFGTSGAPIAFFVSELRPFENFLRSKWNFTW